MVNGKPSPETDAAKAPIDALMIREVMLVTGAAKPTVVKRLRGKVVRGVVADRIDRELRARGIEPGALALKEAS